MEKKLYRDSDTVVSGVCSGLARRLGMDPILVRILLVLLTVASAGFFAFFYIALWAILPKSVVAEPIEARTGSIPPVKQGNWTQDGRAVSPWAILGVWMAATALCFLFSGLVLGAFFDVSWWQAWPFAIVNLGFVIMFAPAGRDDSPKGFLLRFMVVIFGAFLLPFSTGVMSWDVVFWSVSGLWPLFLVVLGLLLLAWGQDNQLFAFAACAMTVLMLLVSLVHYGPRAMPEEDPVVVPVVSYDKTDIEVGSEGARYVG